MKLNIKILLLCLIITTSLYAFGSENCEENNNCQEDDYIALRALYLSTNGDNWINNTGWLTEADFIANPTMPAGMNVNTWYGITTNATGCVTCIDMDGGSPCGPSLSGTNNLVGTIPAEIGNLTHLELLVLNRNELSGTIPPEIGNLDNLLWLYLGDNELVGNIPAEIWNLTNLERLYIPRNKLTGVIPPEISNLSNLVWMFMDSNLLSGNIPAEIGQLSNLVWLYIQSNQLSGDIPPEIGNLNNLERLFLNNNELTGLPPEIGNLSNLEQLMLGGNQLTDIPPEIGNLSNLNSLNLGFNALTSVPPELGNLNNLETLDLSFNQLSGNIFPIIINLTNLSRLYLHFNQLTGNIPPEIGNLDLWHLYLSDNQLTGNIPSEIGNMTNLRWLRLNDNQLTGNVPPEFANLTNMTTLTLGNNQLSGCYDANLMSLCTQIFSSENASISDGNNFDATWEGFCDVGTIACFLPIQQSKPLKAYINNRTVILTWETATEMNNKGFEIQRSDNGMTWQRIGWQSGQGNTVTPHAYTYTDLNLLSGISYYRLKQIDFDGNFSYSNIVSVHHKVDRVTVYPVPAKDFVVFDVPNIAAVDEIILYDITGREISRQAFPQDKRLAVSYLNDGVYIYRIFYDNEMYSGKIVVE